MRSGRKDGKTERRMLCHAKKFNENSETDVKTARDGSENHAARGQKTETIY